MENNINNNKEYRCALQNIIEVANKFISGEWDQDAMAEYGNAMQIRNYIPLTEKAYIIGNIMNKHLFDRNLPSFASAEMQKDFFYYVVLQEYGMIDCSNSELTTYENYDLLYPIFNPFIVQFCENDYNSFKDMFRSSLEISNMRSLFDALEEINEEELKEATKANMATVESLKTNEELINKLNDLAIVNNPALAQVVNEIKKIALEEALEG